MLIEYDGTPFSGWQVQTDATLTVQGALERAAEAICGVPIRVHGAGRTDAGVHALGQVAHCDVPKQLVPGRFRDGMNAHLRPHPVAVLSADVVADDFEARFSAVKRHYIYRITNRRANLAVDMGHVWRVPKPLDVDLMREGARRLLGRHDFTTFRDTECQAKSPVRTLDQFDVEKPPRRERLHHTPAQHFVVEGEDLEPGLRVIRRQRQASRDRRRDNPTYVVAAARTLDLPPRERYAGGPEAVNVIQRILVCAPELDKPPDVFN
ncbi:MAG: tRNA pseudouridine synthase A [Hyphomicrobiales bacterium]|nr:tRNA pseudouridine synthase A [Hyphomicrobiales bacterium]